VPKKYPSEFKREVVQSARGREVSPGRFDFIVQAERGVITSRRGWATKSVERFARSYGWDWS